MKVSECNVLDRRSFIKGMLAAGATVTVTSCVPLEVTTPAATTVPAAGGPAWIHPKSLVRAKAGYGGNLNWKPGDTVKMLPPEKIDSKAGDELAQLSKDKLTEIYRRMMRCRRFQDMSRERGWAGQKSAGGSDSGEESICAGFAALNPDDWFTSTHRPEPEFFAAGMNITGLRALVSEQLAKTTGYSKGMGGKFHLVDKSIGALGSNGIVGGGILLAAGAAWAEKCAGTKKLAVAVFGDGATHSYTFYSGVRNAQNYKLPCIFAVQNNFFCVDNPIQVSCPSPYVADYFVGMGLPCVMVDGTDVAQVYVAFRDAALRARAGDGPTVIEILSLCWYEHKNSPPKGVYFAQGVFTRTDEETLAWITRDPIKKYGNFLLEKGILTQAELDAVKAEATAMVQDAYSFAEQSPGIKAEEALRYAYKDYVPPATQFFGHPSV